MSYIIIFRHNKPNRWCNGQRARVKCGRSRVRATIGSKQRFIKLVFVASPLNMQPSGVRAQTGWFGIRIMCPSGETCLLTDSKNPTKYVCQVQSGHHHHHHTEIKFVLHTIYLKKCSFDMKQQSLTHSLWNFHFKKMLRLNSTFEKFYWSMTW